MVSTHPLRRITAGRAASEQEGRPVSSSSSLDDACRGSINSHIATAGHRLRDVVERDQNTLGRAYFLRVSDMQALTSLGLKALRNWS